MSGLFEGVKSLIKENKREKLETIYRDLKGKLSGKGLSEKDVLALVGGDVFRDHQVECYFPEVVRSKKYMGST